jgi:hypothetical protein
MARRQVLDHFAEIAFQAKRARWPKRLSQTGRLERAVHRERYLVLADVVRMLAAAYCDHPDYHPEWAPQ